MLPIPTKYLFNVLKRAATDGKVYPGEYRVISKVIDSEYGNDNGVLEGSDVIDAVKEIGAEVVDTVGHAISVISHWF